MERVQKLRDTKPTGPTSAAKKAQIERTLERKELYQGLTIRDMVIMFRMDNRTIERRLADVQPSGERRGSATWRADEAAPHLVKPVGDFHQFMKRANPSDCPPILFKEYWNGQRAKAAFEENNGDLWRTEKVVSILAEVFKNLRTKLLLIPDELDRTTTLSEVQREELMKQVHVALGDIRVRLIDQFTRPATREDSPGIGSDDGDGPAEYGEERPGEAEEGDDSDWWDVPDADDGDDGGL